MMVMQLDDNTWGYSGEDYWHWFDKPNVPQWKKEREAQKKKK